MKTSILHVHHAFLFVSLPSLHNHDVKISRFVEDVNTRQRFSFLFKNLDTVYWISTPEILLTFDKSNDME